MAKVFISVLGTNDYEACTYKFGDRKGLANVRFVQEAMVNEFCKSWTSEDRILLFATEKARKLNWEDNGHKDTDERPLKRRGLKSGLERLDLPAKIEVIPIPEGQTEQEIKEIFQTFYDNIKVVDEIIFDITHSFRSIPMLAMVVLHYAKVLKEVTLNGIYYGAFEVLGPLQEVRKKPLEKRLVPVFDLTPFDNLLDWTVAVGVFVRSGDASLATRLAERQARGILKRKKGQDENARQMRKVAGVLDTFSKDIATCRGLEISKDIIDLRKAIERCRDSTLDPAFLPLLAQVEKRLEPFTGEDVADGIRAAEWCAEHNLVQQGYTILRESLISYVCQGMRIDPTNFWDRGQVSNAIGSDLSTLKRMHEKKSSRLKDAPEEKPYYCIFSDKLDLLRLFEQLFGYRNDINHAGMRKSANPAETLIVELHKLIRETKTLLFNANASDPSV